jgi:PDDEXK-like domain of unknown function (DUF3799)
MNPGIYNLTAEQYHADPAPTASLSNSIANILLDQSPLHAWMAHPRLNPAYEREVNNNFDLGTAAHLMLLERREDKIVRVQADDWRTKAAKEARDTARANGQHPVLERQYADIVNMCTAAQDYMLTTELGDMLATGLPEQTILWQEGALWYRSRPDLLSADKRVTLDYKSTSSAAPDFVAKQIGRMGYDLQSEFYTRGVNAVTGREPVFVFLFQEVTKPYACSLISLSNTFREVGKLKLKRAMQLWETCVTADKWPAYTNKILYAEPKPWDAAEMEATKNDQEEEA